MDDYVGGKKMAGTILNYYDDDDDGAIPSQRDMWTSKWGKGGLLPRQRRGSSWSGETLGVGVGGGIGAIPSRKDPVPFPSIRRNTICDILPKWQWQILENSLLSFLTTCPCIVEMHERCLSYQGILMNQPGTQQRIRKSCTLLIKKCEQKWNFLS